MVTVILMGKADAGDSEELHGILSPYGTMFIKDNEILGSPDSKLLLMQCDRPVKTELQSGILVAFGKIPSEKNLKIPSGFLGLASSKDPESLAIFKKAKIPTLTFGMSNEDSLVLSGVRDHSASVCLQRGLVTLKGRKIEPREYPAKLETSVSLKNLLIAYGILLLADIDPI